VSLSSSIVQDGTVVDGLLQLSQPQENSVELHTSSTIEEDPEPSIVPEESDSIMPVNQKPLKIETDSIHPFARQKKEQGRQVSKTEKKKQKKEKQATKKKADAVASVASEQSEPEVLSAQELGDMSKSVSYAAKQNKTKVEWDVLSANTQDRTVLEDLRMKGLLVSVAPVLEKDTFHQINSFVSDQSPQSTPKKGEQKTAIARFEKLSTSGVPRLPAMLKIPAPPAIPVPMEKRTVSVTKKSSIHMTNRALSVASSNADVASDDSSPMTTPHTAKEFQTPTPSPLPPSRLDSPSASIQPVETGEASNSVDINSLKKGRKRKKRNNKKSSVDKSKDLSSEEQPKEGSHQAEIAKDDRVRSRSCSSENKENQSDHLSNLASEDDDNEAKKSVDAESKEKQEATAETTIHNAVSSGKENAPKMSYAQMARATPNSPATISLTPRSPNILSSQKNWD
jgi:hypothetical protein